MSASINITILSLAPVCATGLRSVVLPKLHSTAVMKEALESVDTDYVGISSSVLPFRAVPESVSFMVDCLDGQEAVMVYADYVVTSGAKSRLAMLSDPEKYVVRDSFDFGPLMVVRTADALSALKEADDNSYSSFYALALYLQNKGAIYHTGMPVGFVSDEDKRDSGEKQFDYVDPKNADVQKERERAFTGFLKSIRANVDPSSRIDAKPHGEFKCRASVIIPVKDRVNTVGDAVRSALGQKTSFDFNVIVVDNHSSDGTTELLRKMSSENENVILLTPERVDLGIGGCWNLAINDVRCGKYAVQLDSDDLYSSPSTLQTIVDKFSEKNYALVVGSYKLVDFALNEIPPGVIDHKEWTDDNGANNILRINGMGAPRAFLTSWLRKHPFPNVSYGEDYAAVLMATRHYQVGRIFSVLYLCRRWQGNSDSGLTPQKQVAHDAYKDKLRSDEICARIDMNVRMASH